MKGTVLLTNMRQYSVLSLFTINENYKVKGFMRLDPGTNWLNQGIEISINIKFYVESVFVKFLSLSNSDYFLKMYLAGGLAPSSQ
jgi:hypothetical protein